jgi:hypothetical protein
MELSEHILCLCRMESEDHEGTIQGTQSVSDPRITDIPPPEFCRGCKIAQYWQKTIEIIGVFSFVQF